MKSIEIQLQKIRNRTVSDIANTTHEELIAKLTPSLTYSPSLTLGAISILNSLRSVVELHKPFMFNSNNPQLCCKSCDVIDDGDLVPAPYPCPTIQAIEKEIS